MLSRLLALVIGAAVVLATAGDAAAQAAPTPGSSGAPKGNSPDGSVQIESGPNGVTIYIAISQQTPGNSGGSSSTSSSVSSGSQRTCSADIMNIGLSLSAWYQAQAPLHPGASPWTVLCDDGYFAVVWVPRDAGGNVQVVVSDGAAIDPVSVAMELLNHLPIPDIAIEANPSTGLVALPSWFWIDGYDGSPISSSDALPGVTVDVEVEPLVYRWSFGDGTTAETTSLGQRYPAESDIRHVYEQSSLVASGAYSITVEVTFAARYRVNGGAWEALEPITRSFSNDYPVQQLQSVLVGQ